MHTGEDSTKFFRISFVERTNSALILRSRILNKVEALFETLFVKSVAGSNVLHLNGSTYIACAEFFNRSLDLTANGINLSETFLRVAVGIVKVGANFKSTLHYLEI